MVDISMTEREKTIIGKAIAMLRFRFGKRASVESIHKELINHPHPLVRKITETTNYAADQIKNELKTGGTWWQHDNVIRLTELGIWCITHHKKYRKIFENFASTVFDTKDIPPITTKSFSYVDTKMMNYIMRFAYKMMKRQWTYDKILSEMELGSNKAFRHLLNKIATALEDIEYNPERVMLYDIIATLMWFAQHDTAYREIIIWIVYQLGNDEIKEIMKPFYVEDSKKWYINIWHDHRIETAKLKAKGEIGIFGHDMVEEMSVPEMRNAHLAKIIKGGKS